MGTHFFTGFPGFIATELIKELVRVGEVEKIVCSGASESRELAKDKATSVMKEMNVAFPFEILVGDITQPGLGMDAADK